MTEGDLSFPFCYEDKIIQNIKKLKNNNVNQKIKNNNYNIIHYPSIIHFPKKLFKYIMIK